MVDNFSQLAEERLFGIHFDKIEENHGEKVNTLDKLLTTASYNYVWLNSDVELISIRPKEKVFRELVLTKDERNFVRWSGWIFLPALSLSLGIYNWWRRR